MLILEFGLRIKNIEGQLFSWPVCSKIQNPNSKIQIVNSSNTPVLKHYIENII